MYSPINAPSNSNSPMTPNTPKKSDPHIDKIAQQVAQLPFPKQESQQQAAAASANVLPITPPSPKQPSAADSTEKMDDKKEDKNENSNPGISETDRQAIFKALSQIPRAVRSADNQDLEDDQLLLENDIENEDQVLGDYVKENEAAILVHKQEWKMVGHTNSIHHILVERHLYK